MAKVYLLTFCIVLSGCVGTTATRRRVEDCTPLGGYPYKAVVYDIGELGLFAIVTLPFDFVCDSIALPMDLIAWGMGYHRSYSSLFIRKESGGHDR